MEKSAPFRQSRVDTLCGDFIIYQPENGQRYTTDEMLVAWLSVRTIKESVRSVNSFLDLGSGLCSVPMIILWALPAIQGSGIEINRSRLDLGKKSLAANGLTSRFQLIHGDIRETILYRKFNCVTSSPPYYTAREGVLSPNSDKAAARFELNGSIEAYFQSAAEHLHDGGCFITVYPCQYSRRVFEAAHAFGFSPERQVDIIPRSSKPAFISLFAFIKAGQGQGAFETLSVRNNDQSFTDAYRKVRQEVGFPAPKSTTTRKAGGLKMP